MSNIQIKKQRLLAILCSVIFLTSCAGKSYFRSGNVQKGLASWYGPDFHGKLTSNREIYNMHALTAAHKTLPFGAYVRVINLNNGKSIVVRINDRGPFIKGRIIDLSYAAARKLGLDIAGVAPVKIKVLKQYSPKKSSQKFSVQVGSFSHKKNAKILQKKLQKNYRNVYISKIKTSFNTLYRVRIKVRSIKSAEKVVKKLMKQGHKAHILEEH